MEVFVGVLTIFVLAIFIGFEVITKVPPTLHTPLMSGSNAISGITLIGALLSAGSDHTTLTTILALVPMALSFGEGAELRSPLAITVASGLFFSTLLTLVVIPAAYVLVPSRVAVESDEEEGGLS